MKKLAIMLPFIAVAGMAHADLRSEITASFKKIEMASMSKDVKGTEAAYRQSVTPDFKYVQGGKAQDFKTFLGEFTMSITMTDKITSHSTRILSLTQNGDKATGQIERKMAGFIKGQDKKSHVMDWTGVFTEEYRKVGGKWKTAKMTAGKQKFLMDGKAVSM